MQDKKTPYHWYVIYTKPQCEQKAHDKLSQIGVEAYCPVYTEMRQWSDRKKKLRTPYFKSYVFVKLREQDRKLVFAVPYVVRYLHWLGRPAIIRDKEMEELRNFLEDNELHDHQITHLQPGDKVSFKKGALKDQPAVIAKVGKKKLQLVLPALGYKVVAKISDVTDKNSASH
ncbi:UpxY family transcription antiterminator [Arenibacter aquaticus]|uniref:UpxY family transcription antiterminator n=1 Tax=Arenibacter aquaticus TaxID=2489054 RepID=A0A3S0CK92_9FLAO|nr:UpxY family transcription antiterminator [Arenibacter aquaticus]RTE51733.1 UpxY family transcription antiterminator [Arenibacter aquaticus]